MKLRQVAPDISGIREDHVARYQFAVDQICKLNITGQVLDVGCGVGYGSMKISADCCLDVMGIDIDQETIDYAAEHYSSVKTMFVLADMVDIDQSPFEVMAMFEIIEHSSEAPGFLARASKQCKYLFGSVPNEDIVPFSRGGYNTEHYRHYTPDEILQELENAGWIVTIMGSQKGKKGPAAKINTLNRHGRTIVFMAQSIHA